MFKSKKPKKFTGNFKNLVSFTYISIRPCLKNYFDGMTAKKDLERIIKDLCKKHKITIDRVRFKSPVGRAWISDRHVKIPVIKGIIEFMVALHEIGHILNGYIEPKCVDEYHAELWAIKKAKRLKVDGSPYYKMSMAYVLRNLAEDHNKGRIDITSIPREIKKYVKLIEPDLASWQGYYVDIYDSHEKVIIKKNRVVYYNSL